MELYGSPLQPHHGECPSNLLKGTNICKRQGHKYPRQNLNIYAAGLIYQQAQARNHTTVSGMSYFWFIKCKGIWVRPKKRKVVCTWQHVLSLRFCNCTKHFLHMARNSLPCTYLATFAQHQQVTPSCIYPLFSKKMAYHKATPLQSVGNLLINAQRGVQNLCRKEWLLC
jgi:hypothetical protein